ncbi:MAG: DUF1360 domain-containing protein [Pseudomonadales bacterium]|nr:DUF1360 domain-containing protein [Pseudomonadales bacterium]
MTILFYVACAFGLAYIVGHSRISLPFRLVLARPSGPGYACFACPSCNELHLDLGEWATRPHHTHLCLVCGRTFELKEANWRSGMLVGQAPPEVASGLARYYGVASVLEERPPPRSAVRDFLVELLECPACFGTWTGFVVGLLVPQLPALVWPGALPLLAAAGLMATFTACSNYLLARLTGLTPSETK